MRANFTGLILGLTATFFAQAVVSPAYSMNACENLFLSAEASQLPDSKTIMADIQKLRANLKAVRDGRLDPSAFVLPNSNYQVKFRGQNARTSGYLVESSTFRISRGILTDGSEGVLVTVNRRSGDTLTVGLGEIDLKSVELSRDVTPAEQAQTIERFEESIRKNQFVNFVTMSSGQPRVEFGRVSALERGEDGRPTRFIFVNKSGFAVSQSVNKILPDSIRTFSVTPRDLNIFESNLLNKMKPAFEGKRYVTFVASRGGLTSRFEGWITGVELLLDGEYLIRVSRSVCEAQCWDQSYRLGEIDLRSFVDSPRLEVPKIEKTKITDWSAVHVTATQSKPGVWSSVRQMLGRPAFQSRVLSKSLLEKLAVFADSTRASGEKLPAELESMVQPNSELHVYFQGKERIIRLTIQRHRNGDWSFGNTGFDERIVTESYVDREGSRYTRNEKHQLEYPAKLPANDLRYQLNRVRSTLMTDLINREFPVQNYEWSRVIPEDYNSSAMQHLLIRSEGMRFDLVAGLVKENFDPSREEHKLLEAIKYLTDQRLLFRSPNAGSSGIKTGIYPQSDKAPTTLYLMGYDFGPTLFKAMEDYGLKYEGGRWRRPGESARPRRL